MVSEFENEHNVETCEDDHEELIAGPTTRLRRRIRAEVQYARSLWRDRDVNTIAALVYAHRGVLDDEPRLRGMIDHELRHQINEVRNPLGWRRTDLHWALLNVRRALRGQDPHPLPYEVVDEVSVAQPAMEFERGPQGAVLIRAERRRRARRA